MLEACREGDITVVRDFLQWGVDPNSRAGNEFQDEEQWSGLLFASRYGHLQIAAELLKHGADVDITTPIGRSAL